MTKEEKLKEIEKLFQPSEVHWEAHWLIAELQTAWAKLDQLGDHSKCIQEIRALNDKLKIALDAFKEIDEHVFRKHSCIKLQEICEDALKKLSLTEDDALISMANEAKDEPESDFFEVMKNQTEGGE